MLSHGTGLEQGAPAAAQFLDSLIACGCQKIVSAGSLANVREHDSRDWGKGSLDTALRLCIAVLRSF